MTITELLREDTLPIKEHKQRNIMLKNVLRSFNTALVGDLGGAQALVEETVALMDGSVSP